MVKVERAYKLRNTRLKPFSSVTISAGSYELLNSFLIIIFLRSNYNEQTKSADIKKLRNLTMGKRYFLQFQLLCYQQLQLPAAMQQAEKKMILLTHKEDWNEKI